jgi:hypothetical protein
MDDFFDETSAPPASAPDDAHSHLSSLRESVLKHQFLGELLSCLWQRGRRDVDLAQAMVDFSGYDLMLEWSKIARHTQLKASYKGAKTRAAKINRRLLDKPSGCVVWMIFDEKTLRLCSFLWFGGAPGEPLPDLGDKVALHTKGDNEGTKFERPDIRLVSKSRFRRLSTIAEVGAALFGEYDEPTYELREASHRTLLLRHLARNARSVELADDHDRGWLRTVQKGNFSAIPETLDWGSSAAFADLIEGYRLGQQAGLGDLRDFCPAASSEAKRTGVWHGTALELWVTLFGEHRRLRHGGIEPAEDERKLLDELCRTLRRRLFQPRT